MDPLEQLSGRLLVALERAYLVLEHRVRSTPARLMMRTLRPALVRSLAGEPARMAALLTWAWARIPELLGDAVDLNDQARVAQIVAAVELHEFGDEAGLTGPTDERPAGPTDEPPAHPGGQEAADYGEPV